MSDEKIIELCPTFVDIKQAVNYVGIPAYQIRAALKEKKVPFIKSGNKYLINLTKCREYFEKLSLEFVELGEEVGGND